MTQGERPRHGEDYSHRSWQSQTYYSRQYYYLNREESWPNNGAGTIFLAEATTWEIVWNGTIVGVGIEKFTSVFADGIDTAGDGID